MGGRPHERGVVAAASYEARAVGVHSAMPLRTAARLCPAGVFLPPRPERYRDVSRTVMRILASVTPQLEPISLDEAFLDVTSSRAAFGDGERMARLLKDRVRNEVGLTLSVGVATNKLCAKVASDLRKPDALVVVAPGREAEFLAALPVRRLWGVGPESQRALAESGVTTIGQLAALPDAALRRRFGVFGEQLGLRARGIDPSPVQPFQRPKSIGHEVTFDHDVTSGATVERTLLALADEVAARLREADLVAGAVRLKLRVEGFETLTRQAPLGRHVRDAEPLFSRAVALLDRAWPEARAVRLVGITAIQLSDAQQLTLFDTGSGADRLARSMDAVRSRFGPKAITRARLVGTPRARRFDFGERPREPLDEG